MNGKTTLDFIPLARVGEDWSYELYLGGVTFQRYWAVLRRLIFQVGNLGKAFG